MRDPDRRDANDPRLGVHLDLSDAGAVGVRRRGADARPPIPAGAARRRVRPDGPDRPLGGLGQLYRLGKRHAALRVLGVKHTAVGKDNPVTGDREFFRGVERESLSRALGRLERGIARHQGDAARVAPQVDGGKVGVGGDHGDLEGIDAQHFGDDVGEHRVGALADFRRATEDRHSPAAVAAQLHARMRHVVPIDRQAGARDVAGAREPDAATLGELAELLLPARACDDLLDARAEAHRADAQIVGGERVWWDECLEAQLRRVELQLLGDLVDVDFEGEARLRRTVAALGTARRLVGEGACALEAVAGNVVGHGLQRARVIGARYAVGAVAASVEQRAEMHARDRAVLLHARLHPHQRRVAAAVAVEDLFARERDLDGASGHHRQFGDGDLVVEGIALAAEPAAVRRRDHADPGGREPEDLGQGAVHVMGRLRGAPDRELAVRRPVRYGGVLLHGEVRAPLVEEAVLAHEVGLRKPRLDVAKFEGDDLLQVAAVAVVVDARLRGLQRLLRRGDGRERLVVHGDEMERGRRDVFTYRGHRRDGVAHEPHLALRQGVLVLAHGENAEGNREVAPGERRMYTGKGQGAGGVDGADARVRLSGAEQFGEQHAWEKQVVGELRRSGHLGGGVDFPDRLADDTKLVGGRAVRR